MIKPNGYDKQYLKIKQQSLNNKKNYFLYDLYINNNFEPNINFFSNQRFKTHFPPAIKEWNNSIYTFNPNLSISLSAIDKMVIKIVKSFFNAYFILNSKLSVNNKIYVSKPEIKHTNSNVIITIYKYNSHVNDKKNMDWKYKHINNPILNIFDAKKDKNKYLSNLISKFYEKKVIFRVIDLQYLHLNTSILVEYLANKLTNRKGVLSKYRYLLKNIKLPYYNKFYQLDKRNKDSLKNFSLLNNLTNVSVKNLKTKLNLKKNLINQIIVLTKYKALVGIRIKIGGRLTRRNIAAKSVVKVGNKGTLKNIDSSFKQLSVVNLRGHVNPNIDYFNFNSKSRNGAYNVKGWISNN
uniref:ribosomal protein S3 n=1 Tax=Urnula craterium TaxID=96586 RepID=UPI002237B8E9|nr:ribosomal protein S3 [Urnula craterium]UYF20395.1 ribosomal protein S3 [Urnula craterium]